MNTYFKVIDDIKAAVVAEPFINTVTQGDITDIDLNKITLFPLCHIQVSNATVQPNVITIQFNILLMDIVDHSKNDSSDDIRGNNNEMDVLNNQLNIASRLEALVRRHSNWETYELGSSFSCEPFSERFDNNLAGWSVDFTITIQNGMTNC